MSSIGRFSFCRRFTSCRYLGNMKHCVRVCVCCGVGEHTNTTHNTQHTTHNTQHTTHNTQHTTQHTQHTQHMKRTFQTAAEGSVTTKPEHRKGSPTRLGGCLHATMVPMPVVPVSVCVLEREEEQSPTGPRRAPAYHWKHREKRAVHPMTT